jgi:hypothetical protein
VYLLKENQSEKARTFSLIFRFCPSHLLDMPGQHIGQILSGYATELAVVVQTESLMQTANAQF